jgi:hypothetical protein
MIDKFRAVQYTVRPSGHVDLARRPVFAEDGAEIGRGTWHREAVAPGDEAALAPWLDFLSEAQAESVRAVWTKEAVAAHRAAQEKLRQRDAASDATTSSDA